MAGMMSLTKSEHSPLILPGSPQFEDCLGSLVMNPNSIPLNEGNAEIGRCVAIGHDGLPFVLNSKAELDEYLLSGEFAYRLEDDLVFEDE